MAVAWIRQDLFATGFMVHSHINIPYQFSYVISVWYDEFQIKGIWGISNKNLILHFPIYWSKWICYLMVCPQGLSVWNRKECDSHFPTILIHESLDVHAHSAGTLIQDSKLRLVVEQPSHLKFTDKTKSNKKHSENTDTSMSASFDLTSRSRKLMLSDVSLFCIVPWYQLWCLWVQ